MGHGLPVSIGMAKARKLKGDESKVYTLMGDGECQEGTTWESILIAGHLKLDNLVVIVDNNKIQGSGRLDDILPVEQPLIIAATAAGWEVLKIDGHNDDLIDHHFSNKVFLKQEKPILVIADTIKGRGVSFMEDQPSWHSNWMGPELEKQALEELS
jgi:transketolase